MAGISWTPGRVLLGVGVSYSRLSRVVFPVIHQEYGTM